MSSNGIVVVTFPAFDVDDPESGGVLTGAGLEIRLAPKTGARTPDDVVVVMADAVAAIVSSDPFDRRVFDACPNLRVLARTGVGFDSIDIEAATAAGVVVTTTPGVNNEVVGDHTLALILAAVRRVVESDASVRRGEWKRGSELPVWDLHGATVGIVGLGAIGRGVARRLLGFDCSLLAYDVDYWPMEGVERVSLPELLGRSQIITVHVPLVESTRGLIGARELALARPDAILVSTSRGGIVDEDALVEALRSGRLRASALDVFANEPPAGSPLLGLPNVVLTAHLAGLSEASITRMLRLAAQAVVCVLEGGEPQGVVNPQVFAAVR